MIRIISRADANNKVRDNQVKSVFPKPRRTKWTRAAGGSVFRLDNAKGAGCAEGLSIVEEVPIVESEAIVDVKSELTRGWTGPLKVAAAQPQAVGRIGS
jgi:hypothetical protein